MLNISPEAGRVGKERNEKPGNGEKPKRSLKRYLFEKMQTWINGLLEAERDEFLGRSRYKLLSEEQDNYGDGYRSRRINFFGLGQLELKVPRDRNGEFCSGWLPEGKGQDAELESFLAEVFLAGCSTRDLARITEKHLGPRYDSKQISRIVARSSQDLEAWRVRRLEGRQYKFLYLDGSNFAVWINRQVSRQSFCAVLGVSEEGQCFEVLAWERGDRERMDLWENVLGDLLERGLNAEGVERGIMDGLPGLESLFPRFFPRTRTQRGQKHAKANAGRQVRKAEREEFSKDLHRVFYAAHEAAARTAFFAVKDRWGKLFPSAVGRIEKDVHSLLTFFQFDTTYWTVLRTTNPIERLNKEFKRRTKAMEVTGGEISTYRCLAYVAQTMEYSWSFHPLSQWASVYTQNAA